MSHTETPQRGNISLLIVFDSIILFRKHETFCPEKGIKKRLFEYLSKRGYILCWFKSVTSSFDLRNSNNDNNNNNNNFINMSFVVVYRKIIGDTYLGELRISYYLQTFERLPSLLC